MKAVKIILAVAGVTLLFTGLVFITGGRQVTGAVMLGIGVFLIINSLRKPKTRDVVIRRELELSGDVNLEGMKCNQCGGILSSENMSVKAGAVFVSCPYCSSEYRIEEVPKW